MDWTNAVLLRVGPGQDSSATGDARTGILDQGFFVFEIKHLHDTGIVTLFIGRFGHTGSKGQFSARHIFTFEIIAGCGHNAFSQRSFHMPNSTTKGFSGGQFHGRNLANDLERTIAQVDLRTLSRIRRWTFKPGNRGINKGFVCRIVPPLFHVHDVGGITFVLFLCARFAFPPFSDHGYAHFAFANRAFSCPLCVLSCFGQDLLQ
mmetsp:Transcript_37569/g.77963  ORF Transcript_37569/g.77963 Transcript_37569/m.77963 type:complete len:205 (-) Transcript_37569:456-1070(-)